ncbi:SDR family NAD(P)-dependent oxidoreductase [Salinibacterium sp. G-O1]|uniref:SDR family NAD(P)-dependent oxidoreductase n=1 Tax=Salinibacterium sp. G-O1 TaxID=3046208 RepID=UPI0024BB07D1|nr:SDR family NAD(P)-dependent oxidoreductase [Salinibacterium sp. G-O1]MDJ0333788.1 SDR family NAD(P)-dependent oxidoreductase [Salinibacterium sp. G-O1]
MSWNPAHPPRQDGRTFVVTGGSAGLGYFAAEQLARAGGHVVLATRSPERAARAEASIRGNVAGASVDSLTVDLASLASVREAGSRLADYGRIDGLILNAGVTSGSNERQHSVDGFELTMATNFIGHFALTALAWPALTRTAGSRVVGLGSLSTFMVPPHPGDMLSQRSYNFFRAYAFSKHAMHGFILELDRRTNQSTVFGRVPDVAALLAHPGYAIDGLTPLRPGIADRTPLMRAAALAASFGTQGKNRGAAPTVRAALDPALTGGEFIGPKYLTHGRPVLAHPAGTSASPEFGGHIWALAEEWTGRDFDV